MHFSKNVIISLANFRCHTLQTRKMKLVPIRHVFKRNASPLLVELQLQTLFCNIEYLLCSDISTYHLKQQ